MPHLLSLPIASRRHGTKRAREETNVRTRDGADLCRHACIQSRPIQTGSTPTRTQRNYPHGLKCACHVERGRGWPDGLSSLWYSKKTKNKKKTTRWEELQR